MLLLWLSNILLCICTTLLYPFLCQRTFRLLPCLGYCKQSCSEHRIHISFLIMFFSEYMPRSGIAESSISSVQLLSCVRLFATPWTAAHQASLSVTNYQSLLKLVSIESVMPSNHLILCHPFLRLPSIFPSTRVFSNESVLCIRWPKY